MTLWWAGYVRSKVPITQLSHLASIEKICCKGVNDWVMEICSDQQRSVSELVFILVCPRRALTTDLCSRPRTRTMTGSSLFTLSKTTVQTGSIGGPEHMRESLGGSVEWMQITQNILLGIPKVKMTQTKRAWNLLTADSWTRMWQRSSLLCLS